MRARFYGFRATQYFRHGLCAACWTIREKFPISLVWSRVPV
jgi:hypothetical protein